MKLTAEDLLKALTTCCGDGPGDRAEAVVLVRRSQPSFAASLYSAWQAEGDELSPSLRHDLDAARARIDFYRSIADELAARVPGLISIKGLEVADLYPAGIARAMNDLDYVAPSEQELWPAVGWLIDQGWGIDTATFSEFAGRLQVMVSLCRPHEDPYQLRYGVEVATYYSLGDLGGIPPVPDLPVPWRVPGIKNMLMLLFERFEQPFRARDLIDASLLVGSLDPDLIPVLHEAIAGIGLSGEYAELVRLVDRAGFGPLPSPPTHPWTRPVARARRAARSAGYLTNPVTGVARHLQRRNVRGSLQGAEAWLWSAAQSRVPVRHAIRGGLLGFGLPLEIDPPSVQAAEVHTRGNLTWVDTPIARFLLTIGDEVTESAVLELSGTPASTEVPA